MDSIRARERAEGPGIRSGTPQAGEVGAQFPDVCREFSHTRLMSKPSVVTCNLPARDAAQRLRELEDARCQEIVGSM